MNHKPIASKTRQRIYAGLEFNRIIFVTFLFFICLYHHVGNIKNNYFDVALIQKVSYYCQQYFRLQIRNLHAIEVLIIKFVCKLSSSLGYHQNMEASTVFNRSGYIDNIDWVRLGGDDLAIFDSPSQQVWLGAMFLALAYQSKRRLNHIFYAIGFS
ncbi:hypothetical protein ACJX0J_039739 [Zea mays]